MLNETLSRVFERDLQKLETEIRSYRDEDKLWLAAAGISNSAGNLCLHLLGNLNHFIGATLGHTGYIRRREDEFSLKHIPRQDLLMSIEDCRRVVKKSLAGLSGADMQKDFSLEVFGKKDSVEFILVHLATHLTYHLGQINYHRRLLDH